LKIYVKTDLNIYNIKKLDDPVLRKLINVCVIRVSM